MPITYLFSNDVVLLELAGTYSVEDMKNQIANSLDDPGCPENAVMLLDLRQDQSVRDRSPQEIRDMSYFFGEIRDRINRRLCMVTADNLAFGLMNMARAYDQSLGISCNVFTDMDKALAWLNSSEGSWPEQD